MASPATSGNLVTSLTGMQIGDYIKAQFSSTNYTVTYLGSSSASEANYLGTSPSGSMFYFIKVDKGLLIADRVILSGVAWDTLNTQKVIQGKSGAVFSDNGMTPISGMLRSITGGVAFADSAGNYSTSDSGNGSFPTNNEWSKYIVNSTLGGKISVGDDSVWHWSSALTWTQDTPTLAIGASNSRVIRGQSSLKYLSSIVSSSTTSGCFRPVFQYTES